MPDFHSVGGGSSWIHIHWAELEAPPASGLAVSLRLGGKGKGIRLGLGLGLGSGAVEVVVWAF